MFYLSKHLIQLTRKTLLSIGTLCLLCLPAIAHAFDSSPSYDRFAYQGEDDTILIEGPAKKTKFSYSAAIKSFSKHVLRIDIDALLSGGKNCTESVIRNFYDLADRTKYRLNLKQDRVEVKLTVNF